MGLFENMVSFSAFLLTACQHMQIQEYVRLLSTWCDFNCHSRQFLLGSALLNMGEPEKACDWMIKGAGGIGTDVFLTRWIFHDFINSKILRNFWKWNFLVYSLKFALHHVTVYFRFMFIRGRQNSVSWRSPIASGQFNFLFKQNHSSRFYIKSC